MSFNNATKETFEQSETALIKHGQRKINLIWEYTQALIAIVVVMANLIVGIHVGIFHDMNNVPIPAVLSNSLFLVIGFYFGRTNHTAIGGVGGKFEEPYIGR